MFRKPTEFYVRIALSLIAVLLVINLLKLPGHTIIKRAIAAIGTITGEGNTNYLVRFAGATPSNSVGDSIIYDSGTNVGIGTAAPGYKLTISGIGGVLAVDNASTFLAKNASAAYETWMWPRWSDNVMYTNFGSAGWNIRNNSSSNVMFLQNGGNVGIGTTNPAQKLDVSGNVAATGNLTAGGVGSFGSIQFYGVGGNSGQAVPAGGDYRIYQAPGAWSSPYPDLNIAYHTGISIGAYYLYGGTRFYNNSDMATELMSVGNADNHVRVTNNLYVGGRASSYGITNSGNNDLITYGNINVQKSAFSITNSVPAGTITLSSSGGIFTTQPLQVGSATVTPGTSVLKIIGLTGASGTALHIDANGNVYYQSSSRNTKDNINVFSDDWDKIFKLSPKSFIYKSNGIKSIGYIAEEVEEAGLKELVNYNNNGLPMSLSYGKFIVYLVEQARLQKAEISDLEQRIEKLEKIINNK